MITSLSEVVGHKSGLAIDREFIAARLPEETALWFGEDGEIIVFRSEEISEIVEELLYQLGNIPRPRIGHPFITLFHKYKTDTKKSALLLEVSSIFQSRFPEAKEKAEIEKDPIDVTPIVIEIGKRLGPEGFLLAKEFVEETELYLHAIPWGPWRRVDYANAIELSSLFTEEKLDAFYGNFFDQRFVDYLGQNFDVVGKINWRKFEALTCEFFDRAGFYVEIGPGRNDGGIDARIWPKMEDRSHPPTILVQCKREKEKIGHTVVKALWADVVEEGAKSGLVVTTSSWSPGARKVRSARAYPIGEINRKTLSQWIRAMRSHGAGVFLGH